MDVQRIHVDSLSDIFTLLDRETIAEVLRQHNNDFEAAAIVLAELNVPKQPTQPQQPQPQQQRPAPVPVPAPAPVQRPVAPAQNTRQNVYNDVKNLMGNDIDVNQSTIFAIYETTGGKIQDTANILKEMYHDPALEQQKRAMEEMEAKRAHLVRERERLDGARQQQLKEQQQQAQILKQQQDREKVERQRVDKEKAVDAEQRELKKLELQKREQEIVRQEEERRKREEVELLNKVLAKEREAQKQQLAREQEENQKLILETQILRQELQRQDEEKRKQEELALHARIIKENQEMEIKRKKEVELEEQRRQFEQQQRLLIEQQIAVEDRRKLEIELQRQREVDQRKLDELKMELEHLQVKTEEQLKKQVSDLQRQKEMELQRQIAEIEAQKQELDRLRQVEMETILREKERLLAEKDAQLEKTKLSTSITLQLAHGKEQDSICVTYNLGTPIHTGHCWIGIYPTHQPKNERYLSYKVVESVEGTLVFPNVIPGHYEARLFKDRYDLLQTSQSIRIGPEVELSVNVVQDEIVVQFKIVGGTNNTRDWIGLYSKGLRNKKYLASHYTTNSGTVIFKSPRVPGDYQVRYFIYPTKYNEQAIYPFTIVDNDRIETATPIVSRGDEIKVDFSVNTVIPYSYDWIGLYAAGEENNKNYVESKYTNGTGLGTVSFIAPSTPGEYEFRFFSYSKGKYNTFKVSNKVVVTP
ncbi:hypothetical protein SAMD00019534_011810 [Acytostelium subglobosum LB1]|uniref:hypothetical protein n=1 Tax=Acytostelium subglobosum LB1 TaxID=1410327 RepID=UPI000644A650|nr:hypothetical protein SAMD00019534_011810 [Acytostelium subglobosum LB1]GAM18006.1 hypothetical protein SAMD00019534_011810 [Acytostelium subglobosum LB1]|eukprot:XP_012758602.1 hypothetical protein SAMD00019534_011810 [Acytostelium subglobosum LB1]